MSNISRKLEVKELKQKIVELRKELGVSKSLFKRTLPKVSGKAYSYVVDENGHKQSLRQQYKFLQDLVKFNNERKEKGDSDEKQI